MKKREAFDYNSYDRLSLELKTEAKGSMLEYYLAFGWEPYLEEADSRYADIVHVDLRRPHNIPNKDRLQLLQVKMESAVNRFAIARRDRHSVSLIMSLSFALGGAVSIALGALIAFKLSGLPFIILGSALALIGLAVPLFLIPTFIRIFKNENKKYMAAYSKMGADIARIIVLARELGGDTNDG